LREELLYLDSSAIVKLVLPEPETEALFRLLGGYPERVTSALARVEVLRAVSRVGEDEPVLRRAEEVLDRLGLIRIDTKVLKAAARLEPRNLRSLDAIHLATALSLGDQLAGIAAYDIRLAEAAEAGGIDVLAPE
jgi:predicted nucleic acid-binding protein